MADYEVTMGCRHENQQWEYVFHKAGHNSYAEAIEAFRPFALLIHQLHSGWTILDYIGAANLNRLGRDADRKEEKIGNGTLDVTTAGRPDLVNVSARFGLRGAGGAGRKLYVSGLLDADTVRTGIGESRPSERLQLAINAMLAAIPTAGLSIRQLVLPTPNTPTAYRAVKKIEPDSETVDGDPVYNVEYTKLTTIGEHDFEDGDDVIFSKPVDDERMDGLSGPFKVLSHTATTFLINTKYRGFGNSFVPSETFVRKVEYELVGITNGEFEGFGTRQRGSSGGPAGRSSGKSKRH